MAQEACNKGELSLINNFSNPLPRGDFLDTLSRFYHVNFLCVYLFIRARENSEGCGSDRFDSHCGILVSQNNRTLCQR